jgi:hypothetical protein
MTSNPRASPAHAARPGIRHLTAGGTTGNERLTAAAGVMLLLPLAVIGVTIISLRNLLWIHLFVGMALIGPIALKLGSTGYRFVRYYSGNAAYRRVGPPPALLRVIAPMVVLSTVVVLASGVVLLFAGPQSRNTLLPIHKISFFVWAGFTGIHLLGHLPAVPEALRADYGAAAQWSHDTTGRAGRVISLAGALTAGVVLAILVIGEFGPWLHGTGLSHHHR